MPALIIESYSNISGKLENVSDVILSDIQKIASANDWKIYVSSGLRSHDHDSRHKLGVAVDISAINGYSYGKKDDERRAEFTRLGDELVAALERIGYVPGEYSKRNGEKISRPKAYLWKTMSGGNHFDHIHVSNTTGVKSTTMSTASTTVTDPKSKKITDWNQVKTWIKSKFNNSDYGDYLLINIDGKTIRIYKNGVANINVKTKETWELTKLPTGEYSFKIGSTEYSPEVQVIDTTKDSGVKAATGKVGAVVKDASRVDDEWQTIDYVQTILDFIGFIPGVGDVIDIVNALIYFYREKWIDGVLSLVAVIPVAGSAIAMSLKGAFKAMKASGVNTMIKLALKGDITQWRKFLAKQVKEGKLTNAQLKQMEQWGDEAAKMLRASGRTLKKWETEMSWVGLDAKTVSKTFDEWASYVDKLFTKTGTGAFKVSKMDKVRKTIQKGISKVTWKVVKLPFKLVYMAGNVLTAGLLRIGINSLKTLFGWSTGKQAKLMRALNQSYAKKLIASPMLSAQMMKANRQTASNLEKILPKYFPNQKITNIWDENTYDIYQMLKKLKDSDPKQYRRVAKQIADQSESANNIWYRAFVADELAAAYNVVKPGAVLKQSIADDGVLGVFKEMKFGIKSWDVLSNEVQDLAEQMGYDDKDDPNGLVVPLLFSTYMHTLGATKEETSDTIDPEDVINDDEVSKIKQMYDAAPGDTLNEKKDYLLSEDGISEIKFWAFTKIMNLL